VFYLCVGLAFGRSLVLVWTAKRYDGLHKARNLSQKPPILFGEVPYSIVRNNFNTQTLVRSQEGITQTRTKDRLSNTHTCFSVSFNLAYNGHDKRCYKKLHRTETTTYPSTFIIALFFIHLYVWDSITEQSALKWSPF